MVATSVDGDNSRPVAAGHERPLSGRMINRITSRRNTRIPENPRPGSHRRDIYRVDRKWKLLLAREDRQMILGIVLEVVLPLIRRQTRVGQ